MTAEPDADATIPQAATRPRLAAADSFAYDMMEAAAHALVLARRAGRIETVNRHAERIFGYDRAELQGKPLEMLFPGRFLGQHADPHTHCVADLLAVEGRPLAGLRKNGTEFPVQLRISPIDVDGEPAMLAAIIDLTERRATEAEQDRQWREMARSNADLEEFGYAASHDLMAPLRAISHLVEWITEDIAASASPETLENLRLLQQRVKRMQTLLDGLLAYCRVSEITPTVAKVDTADVVREIVGLLAPPPGFTVACEGSMPVIDTNFSALQVVLENLVSNAIKHHDRAEGQVRISARPVEGAMEFRVSDDGPGIPPAFHERIFVMFQTLASRDKVESSGIGLTIVKKKVENNGGAIWVESAPPVRGTTFVFTWK